ncbi:MAG: DUF1559 domain-containing protein [Planctomycetia bacterium]|nr:DUF1559 domain-containing protein [Planctomycetia bacterium]
MNRQLLRPFADWHAIRFLAGVLAVATCHGISVADDAAIVQRFVGETTLLILKVDPARLSLPADSAALKSTFPGGPEAYDRWAHDAARGIESLRVATNGESIYATIGIPLSKNEWPAFLFVKQKSEQSRNQLTELLGAIHEIQSCSHNGFTVVASGRNVDVEARLKSIVPSPRAELSAAFESVKDYPIQALILLPDYVRRTVTELMPQLPRHLGGGSSSLLTDGLVWTSLGIDPSRPSVVVVIQSKSEKAARELAEQLPKMLLAAYDELPRVKSTIPRDSFQTLLPLLKPTVAGDRLTIRLDDLQSIREGLQLAASAPAAVAEQMRRQTNSDSFKSIIVAMHNHHDTYKVFPPRNEVRDASGRSGLSWRVHILPFLDQQKLYEEFALDQPWDSPHNKPLSEKMPKVFESQWLGIKPGHTTFLAPAGEDTVFGGEQAVKITNITDGTVNTAVLVEVKPCLAVPWTAPQDYDFDPMQPGEGLRAGTDRRLLAALADGSVQMFRADAPPVLLLRLFLKGDGNPLNWSELR